MLFGPAYKGIVLAAGAAIALAREGHDVPFAFDRKEAKDHGEGGKLVGAPLAGRVLIVDDVLTAGTAVRESFDLIEGHGAIVAGGGILLDRMERGGGDLSAGRGKEERHGNSRLSLADPPDLERRLQDRPQISAKP